MSAVIGCLSLAPGLAQAQAQAQTHEVAGSQDLPFHEQDLVGTFASKGCENVVLAEGGELVFLRRCYNWDLATSTVTYTQYADNVCERPLYTFFFAGPYELGRARPELGKVREIQVVMDTVTMKAESDEGAVLLRKADCGPFERRTGMIRDIGPFKCMIKEPRATCIGDNELLMLDGDHLAPRGRTPNMCEPEGRPRSIQTGSTVERLRR